MRGPKALNLVPLIDLFLLLALFGLMLARFPEALPPERRALEVRLPEGQGRPSGGGVRVELDREGRLALNGRRVASLGELEKALKAEGLEGRTVRLEADAGVAHGRVVAVMEVVRRAGGERVEVALTGRPLPER